MAGHSHGRDLCPSPPQSRQRVRPRVTPAGPNTRSRDPTRSRRQATDDRTSCSTRHLLADTSRRSSRVPPADRARARLSPSATTDHGSTRRSCLPTPAGTRRHSCTSPAASLSPALYLLMPRAIRARCALDFGTPRCGSPIFRFCSSDIGPRFTPFGQP